MKQLSENIFYYVNPTIDTTPRLWHRCENYKDRDVARVELECKKETEKNFQYQCEHCQFKYTLDKQIPLEPSRM